MKPISRVRGFTFFVFFFVYVQPLHCIGQQIVVAPDKATGVYQVGETVHWTAEWKGEGPPPGARYVLKSGGLKEVGHGDLKFDQRIARFDSKFDAPGTMFVEVKWQPEGNRNRATAGAVAAPERIMPAAKPPGDFEAFWKGKLKELSSVPVNAQLESANGGKQGVGYWKIAMDNIRGSHIYGQIARPEAGQKFPALLIVQWAGVYPLQKSWVTDRAAEGWLTLNIEAHDLPIDNPESFYRDQSAGPLKGYPSIGNDDREKSYFLRMYLSCFRALEYLKSRPEWDRKTLVVMGASQGGMQTLMLAGLHPRDLTAALALVPAGCDFLGPEAGRASGWPLWYFNTEGKDASKVRETSRYYDVANFAPNIKCPVLVALGLRDDVCAPSTVLAAINVDRARKEVVIMPKSGHQNENGSQDEFNRLCYQVWLPALRQGKTIPMEIHQ